jgi:3-phosphoshikimate 1-carboxyvinyltransferase
VIRETTPSRDHTERMLTAAGVVLGRQDGAIRVTGGQRPERLRLTVPGDISSAAFFLIAAALAGQEITIGDVGVNPTRTGILDVLQRMGATVTIEHERLEAGEPLATVSVRGQALRPVEISAKEVPRLVDELPLVVLLATQAQGTSNIRGAAELRVKETDRIAAVAGELRRLGARIEELPDGFVVSGPSTLRGTEVDSHGDHRMAMMLAVAGSIAAGDTVVAGAEAAGVSFPGFAEVFRRLGGRLDAV